jgi:hypothetical protein
MQLLTEFHITSHNKLHVIRQYETTGWLVTHACDGQYLTRYECKTLEASERVYNILVACLSGIVSRALTAELFKIAQNYEYD